MSTSAVSWVRRGSSARETSGLADMSGGDSDATLEIGRTLELARKRRGLSLKQVEEATKIRAVYLADLEWEHFDVLPAVYMQGYLKTYASFLHLDADAMVGELKRRRSLSEEPPYPLYVGPSEDDTLDDILTALGGAANSRDATGDEEEAGRPRVPPASTPACTSALLCSCSSARPWWPSRSPSRGMSGRRRSPRYANPDLPGARGLSRGRKGARQRPEPAAGR